MSAIIREAIRANPTPDENDVIARAQSLLTRNGRIGPVLPYAQAKRVVENATKPARVTVPEPRDPFDRDADRRTEWRRGNDDDIGEDE